MAASRNACVIVDVEAPDPQVAELSLAGGDRAGRQEVGERRRVVLRAPCDGCRSAIRLP